MKLWLLLAIATVAAAQNRPTADAHNCYPYDGRWADRIDRALGAGTPIAIEQDIAFYKGRPVVSHTDKTTGAEPTLKAHFFDKVRPRIEQALKENDREHWPLIVLHFDFKDLRPELLRAVWNLLGDYPDWIATSARSGDPAIDMKPILVLTEDADIQEQIFYTEVPAGGRLRVFGSAHTDAPLSAPTNYRRWLNYSWHAVEPEGQPKAGAWTEAADARLRSLVASAHGKGYWIRFYTLDGFTEAENQGWLPQYNFGSREAVERRWKAAVDAGVNLIASDQYEDLAAFIRRP